MNRELNESGKEPVYMQIAGMLREKIEAGEFTEGERLMPERKLGETLHVARNTVKQAYEELCRQGYAVTKKGSGTYVDTSARKKADFKVYGIIDETIASLQQMGKGQREIERMFMEQAWKLLPEEEKLKMAWIDCSEEFVRDTAREISEFCSVDVDAFLLDEIREEPQILCRKRYDMFATTINHQEEVSETVQRVVPDWEETSVEKVVLAVSNGTISNIAKLQGTRPVAVVYGSEWYRYSVECFLKEFGVSCPYAYIPVRNCLAELEKNQQRYQAVILPQNPSYRDGLVENIAKQCRKKEITCFSFDQIADQGSLLHLQEQVLRKWIQAGDKPEET